MAVTIDDKNRMDVLMDGFEAAVLDFCSRYGIQDMRQEKNSVWNACMIDINEKYIKGSKDLYINGSIAAGYDPDTLNKLLDIYIKYSALYNKVIILNYFCNLVGIDNTTIDLWKDCNKYSDGLNQKRFNFWKKLNKAREAGYEAALADGRVTAYGPLNHYYHWDAPGMHEEARKASYTGAALPDLSGIAAGLPVLDDPVKSE